jgi:uncharacterized membrane protein YeaQ/YmgE (transglycosylase-associated protein family)
MLVTARRLFGALFLRNLVVSLIVGLLVGLITSAISSKKGNNDVILGILGAILAALVLAFLSRGILLVPTVIVQTIGALVLILLGRLLGADEKK